MNSWNLDHKIQVTQTKIIEWYEHYDGEIYVSFSGGKDSTILLDLARRIYPDIEGLFIDTGLEYPEIRDFVKTKENIVWLKPEKTFNKVIEEYGYPVISKKVSNVICGAKPNNTRWQQLHGIYKSNTDKPSRFNYSKYKYLLDAPFKISDKCCDCLKKTPVKKYNKYSGKYPMLAMMADDSMERKKEYLKTGCNAFNKKQPQSQPMGFWTEQDVLRYLVDFKIPYASIYGDIVQDENGNLKTTKLDRTGCMFCMFGVHMQSDPNRFQQMKITHPKHYDYCINKLGIGKVLDFINIKY
jgi:3'-phosphoadenosine 5'-phosphosulfate sulfotransferase (PAPS reductase)/FAD synthetase